MEIRSDGREPPPLAQPVGAGAPWTTLLEQMTDVGRRLAKLEAAAAAPTTAGRDAVLGELHAQLQEARTDLHWKVLRPVLLDLVRLHDELESAAAADAAAPLAGFRQDVADILYRQGFDPFTVAGERFDARRQQPVNTLPAAAPELVGTVAARVAPGFASEQRVLRPEKVVVYAAAPPAASA